MKRITPLLLFSASVAVGCTQLEDSRIEARQRRMARAAYVTSPGACNGMPHSVDYAKGFEEGYYDVASGGDGCPPALPPEKYWWATYNSPVGQEHVKAWFQGFRDGAAAARADGVASYGTIYVSDEHRNGLKRAAVPASCPSSCNRLAGPRVLTPRSRSRRRGRCKKSRSGSRPPVRADGKESPRLQAVDVRHAGFLGAGLGTHEAASIEVGEDRVETDSEIGDRADAADHARRGAGDCTRSRRFLRCRRPPKCRRRNPRHCRSS